MSYVSVARGEQLVFGSLGALTSHPEIVKVQRYLNAYAAVAGYPKIGTDGKYGATTHRTLKLAVAYWKEHGYPDYPSGDRIDSAGAATAASFFLHPPVAWPAGVQPAKPFGTGPDYAKGIAAIHLAWQEWKDQEASGSTEPDAQTPSIEDLGPGDSGPYEKAGMGTFGWFLIGAAVLAGGVIVAKLVFPRREGRDSRIQVRSRSYARGF